MSEMKKEFSDVIGHVQIDPKTGKRKRGRPRGSGRLQRIRQGKLPKLEFASGVLTVLQVHVKNPRLESYIRNRQVKYVDINGKTIDFVLDDGTRVRVN